MNVLIVAATKLAVHDMKRWLVYLLRNTNKHPDKQNENNYFAKLKTSTYIYVHIFHIQWIPFSIVAKKYMQIKKPRERERARDENTRGIIAISFLSSLFSLFFCYTWYLYIGINEWMVRKLAVWVQTVLFSYWLQKFNAIVNSSWSIVLETISHLK